MKAFSLLLTLIIILSGGVFLALKIASDARNLALGHAEAS